MMGGMSQVVSTLPFPFEGDSFPAQLGAVVENRVASGEEPARVVLHDDDNEWVVLASQSADPSDCCVHHVVHLVERDPSLAEAVPPPIGQMASRGSVDQPWVVSQIYDEYV